MTNHPSQKLVALTGSIGGGKSAVAELLRARGAAIIDADKIAKDLLNPGTESFRETVALFGAAIVTPHGEIDRGAVASQIFTNPALKKKLEAILHPRINAAFLAEVGALRAAGTAHVIVYVVPLLFEAGKDLSLFDEIIVVATDSDQAINRAAHRDGANREDIERRYHTQIPIEEKVARATIVIDNNGPPQELATKVDDLWRRLLQSKGQPVQLAE